MFNYHKLTENTINYIKTTINNNFYTKRYHFIHFFATFVAKILKILKIQRKKTKYAQYIANVHIIILHNITNNQNKSILTH